MKADRTIPDKVTPGVRYAQAVRGGLFDVLDWSGDGTTDNPWEPSECVAAGVCEADARLLVFGADLIAAARDTIPSCLPGGTFADDLLTIAGMLEETRYAGVADRIRAKAEALRAAVARATGPTP